MTAMKVLLIGATGNLGSRLVPALLTHGHSVVAYVRSANRLESLLPASTYQQIAVVEGDAKDRPSIKRAVLDSNCDAVVNTAGVAAVAPWAKSDLPAIFRAVFDAVLEVGKERKAPLRVWFLGGLGVLQLPGTNFQLSSYIPIYLEHRQNLQLLKSLPPHAVNWSMLCPGTMTPESSQLTVPTETSRAKLVANATTPPAWKHSWLEHIPFLGRYLSSAMNATRYGTTLEQNADFIASDLENSESQWIEKAVGIIDPSR